MELVEQMTIPKTWAEREELGVDVLHIPATLDEFFDLVEECDYRIEYFNGEVFSFMSQASFTHEKIVAMLSHLFNSFYASLEDFDVLSSNIKIFSEECQSAFNADMTVVSGFPDYFELKSKRKSTTTIKNPEIIVEVLSDSTRDFDFGAKLNCYKTIPTLKQIIFVDQSRVYISSYLRTSDPNEWLNHDYYSISETLKLSDFQIKIEDIYRKVPVLKA